MNLTLFFVFVAQEEQDPDSVSVPKARLNNRWTAVKWLRVAGIPEFLGNISVAAPLKSYPWILVNTGYQPIALQIDSNTVEIWDLYVYV